MSRRSGGTKRSSWLTFRRRLLLVRLLLRGPATKEQLITTVNGELGEQGYPGDASSALKHDFDALKAEYGCRIAFSRGAGTYMLADLGELALLDLPDDTMEALSFLDASFPAGEALPEHAAIRALIDRVLLLLPPYRQRQYRERRVTSLLHLGPSRALDPLVLRQLRQAIKGRQEIQFDYHDSGATTAVTRHRVAPYAVIFRPEGHAYLDAAALEIIPRRPGLALPGPINYRVDRIIPGSLHLLPTLLPPTRYAAPGYQLRYRIVPAVARRRDLATYFSDSQIDYHPDGSATISATASNLWQARQILLRYGDACEVLEPPELVELFRATARGLGKIYVVEEREADRG